MGLSIRSKMILYTAAPVIAVYVVLFWLGQHHVRTQLSDNAQRVLIEHARNQAARVAVLLGQIPSLAESLGDLVVADPQQPQTLLYAHLIDGLRRTPAAHTAAIRYGDPARGAQMQRGAPAARPFSREDKFASQPGWHIHGELLGFTRPISREGRRIGRTWVNMRIADVYSELERLRSPDIDLLVSHNDGRHLTPPAGLPTYLPRDDDDAIQSMANDEVRAIKTAHGDYWLITSSVPAHPWRVTAAVPVDRALAGARQEILLFAIGLLVSLLVIVTIIGLVARQITRPLASLDDTVQRISRGNFVVSPNVRSDDELGGLASAIGQMARHIAYRENQLHGAREALEQRVEERTSELQESNARLIKQIEENRITQEALRRAREQAEQANRAKSEFLSNISHELRTPLHGVLGNAQILRRQTPADTAQHESLDAIERCGEHLLTLINDILDLTKIEAGQMRLEPQPTDLEQLVEDACTIVAQRADQKDLELTHNIAPGLPRTIRTDPVKLRQILLNLLGNAVKFTSIGSITLDIRQTSEGQLSFVVTDSGIGIPEDKIDAIFDAFQQARDGQAIDGTGLGLAISQRLIRLLGGEMLSVESALGEGSRFEFRIPFEAATDEALPNARSATIPADSWRLANGQHCRIGVVEALAENRQLLATLLRQAGCDVETFAAIDEAGERLSTEHFDLVFVDLRLPDPDMTDMVAALRNDDTRGQPGLIALSTDVYGDADSQVLAAGFDRFLGKPFSNRQLLDVVEHMLDVRFVDDENGTPASDYAPDAWPEPLATTTAGRIRKAIAVGDVASLFQLADELADEPGAPREDVQQLALMARIFDFEGLGALANRLQNTD